MKDWEIRLEGFFYRNPDLDKEEIKRKLLNLAETTLYSIDDISYLIRSLSVPYRTKIDKENCDGLLGIERSRKTNHTSKKRIGKPKKSYFPSE